MGEGSLAWLASAATVAASALEMRVTDPRPLLERMDRDRLERILCARRPRAAAGDHGQPSRRSQCRGGAARAKQALRRAAGRCAAAVQRFGDAVDTDAIIPGEFCHLTDADRAGRQGVLLRPAGVPRAGAGGRDDRGGGRGLGQRQFARARRVGAARHRHPGDHRAGATPSSTSGISSTRRCPYLVVTDAAFYEAAAEGAELEVDLARGVVRDVGTGREFRPSRSRR